MFHRLHIKLALIGAFCFTTSALAAEVSLPHGLTWCEELPSVAEKLKMGDLAEGGRHYLTDEEYQAPGELWGQAGNFTVRFLEVGESKYLTEFEFRIFRLDSAWVTIMENLHKKMGPGESEVVSKATFTPDGEQMYGERKKHTWNDPDGRWEATARQMSNEIDLVKISYEPEACRPEEAEQVNEFAEDKPPKGESREGSIFEYDPYDDDPLHKDTKAAELEEQKKKEEEEKKKEEEETNIDWLEGGDEDVEW